MSPTKSIHSKCTEELDEEIVNLIATRAALVETIISTSTSTSNNAPAISGRTTSISQNPDNVTDDAVTAALALAKRSRTERIRLLSRYNDIKDVAQGLMGMIAEQRGCRVVEVMEELGVADDG